MELFDGIRKLVGGVVWFLHSKWELPTGVSQLLEVKPHPYHHFEVQNSLNDGKRYLGYNLDVISALRALL